MSNHVIASSCAAVALMLLIFSIGCAGKGWKFGIFLSVGVTLIVALVMGLATVMAFLHTKYFPNSM